MLFEYIEQIFLFVVLTSILCLIYLSIQDLNTQKISRDITFFALFTLSAFHILALLVYGYEPSYDFLLGGVVLGFPFFLCVLITKEKSLGMGDVYLFIIMGLLVGYEFIFFALSITVLSALVFSVFKYKKLDLKQKIPFVPFISFGIILIVFLKYLLL